MTQAAEHQGHLSPDDAAWFAERPHREFRCRHLTDSERVPADEPPTGSTATKLIYVRKSDGATVKAWTPLPDMLIAEEDEGRARFAAQAMPNPPPLGEPIEHVETIPATPENAALLQGQRTGTSPAEIQ